MSQTVQAGLAAVVADSGAAATRAQQAPATPATPTLGTQAAAARSLPAAVATATAEPIVAPRVVRSGGLTFTECVEPTGHLVHIPPTQERDRDRVDTFLGQQAMFIRTVTPFETAWFSISLDVVRGFQRAG